jgi:hypothetical protein
MHIELYPIKILPTSKEPEVTNPDTNDIRYWRQFNQLSLLYADWIKTLEAIDETLESYRWNHRICAERNVIPLFQVLEDTSLLIVFAAHSELQVISLFAPETLKFPPAIEETRYKHQLFFPDKMILQKS